MGKDKIMRAYQTQFIQLGEGDEGMGVQMVAAALMDIVEHGQDRDRIAAAREIRQGYTANDENIGGDAYKDNVDRAAHLLAADILQRAIEITDKSD